MFQDNRFCNFAIIVTTFGIAGAYFLTTGELPDGWLGYVLGCSLVAAINIVQGWPLKETK